MTQQINVNIVKPKGSIIGGMFLMLLFSVLLFWLPLIGALIAGIVGGKKAGGIGGAILAVLLPGLILGVIFFSLASSLTGLPLIGSVAGAGGFILSMIGVGPLLLGAVIGGALS